MCWGDLSGRGRLGGKEVVVRVLWPQGCLLMGTEVCELNCQRGARGKEVADWCWGGCSGGSVVQAVYFCVDRGMWEYPRRRGMYLCVCVRWQGFSELYGSGRSVLEVTEVRMGKS